MIMTAELNSHQRVSYYTGVKLIRHHQSASTANPNNNSTSNNNSNNSSANNTAPGPFYHQHHNHFPSHPPHHHHHHQQHPSSLPPHHPVNFHLPCPTGPPHIQHPGGVIHLSNHVGPHPHHHHHNHNGHHHYGGGSNQTTRLYTGSPLIRSTGYHSSSSVSGGSGGATSNKKAFKGHHNRNNQIHHSPHSSNRNGGVIGTPAHYHNQSTIGGSCSSGTSSSSSSNEHLNNIQSPTSSPLTQAKLDISPLKLISSPTLNGDLSSSNNSSPGPQGSPSPSTSSNLSTSSSSPNSADGNKDLDHFYFLDEHWKPSSDGNRNATAGIGVTHADMLDIGNSGNRTRWTKSSSGSPSPLTSGTATTLTMMVDQFFASGHNNSAFGSVDGNNNIIGINGDGLGGGILLRDSNNNIISGQQSNFNEIRPQNDGFHNYCLSGFNSGNIVNGSSKEGTSGLFSFEGGKLSSIHHNSSSTATTVVNVETQIGTFNGQRDLEIRLCFIKGDHHSKAHHGSIFGQNNHQSQNDTHLHYPNALGNTKAITAIGDPFKSSSRPTEQAELLSSVPMSDSEMEKKSDSATAIGMSMLKNKEITQRI